MTTTEDCYVGCTTIVTRPVEGETTTTINTTTSTIERADGGLPVTGDDVIPLIFLALILIFVGAVIVRTVQKVNRKTD